MPERRILMEHCDQEGQCSIDTYEKNGGYQTLRQAIPAIAPAKLVEMVEQSELRGRGGAGFLTGKKWGFLPKNYSGPKYLVCNSDESEPGTFKDRLLIEKDPHQLIEGMILSSYAIGANLSFIYCRGEYFEGLKTLRKALAEAEQRGYLGRNLFGSLIP